MTPKVQTSCKRKKERASNLKQKHVSLHFKPWVYLVLRSIVQHYLLIHIRLFRKLWKAYDTEQHEKLERDVEINKDFSFRRFKYFCRRFSNTRSNRNQVMGTFSINNSNTSLLVVNKTQLKTPITQKHSPRSVLLHFYFNGFGNCSYVIHNILNVISFFIQK